MPTLHVELYEGRTVAQKRAFAAAVTTVAVETLGCTPDSVEVIFVDVKREDWAVGGRLAIDPPGV
jgi:4-oxalocrotonate tautomerase